MSRNRGTAPSLRQLRVGEELRHALARILARGGLADPALADANITVTEVKVSPDLKNATAFVTPLGGTDLEPTVKALNRAAAYLRGQLGHEVTLRYTPRLGFAADHSFEHAQRVRQILENPRVRQDVENPAAEEQESGDGR